MQRLHTGRFGTIEVEKSWINNTVHICKLIGGGYVYASGLPVTSEEEIKRVIPMGPDRDEALLWLQQKDIPVSERQKRIIINPDGSCVFDDGSPVENISDILQYIPPGPFQEAAYKWLQNKVKQEEELQAKMSKTVGQAAMAAASKKKAKMEEDASAAGHEAKVA